jgi:hypothetical protein
MSIRECVINDRLPLTHIIAEDGLSLLAQLCKQCPNILLLDRCGKSKIASTIIQCTLTSNFSNAASKLVIAAKSGSPQEVEYATAILTNACNADIICEDLFNVSVPCYYQRVYVLFIPLISCCRMFAQIWNLQIQNYMKD